MKTGINQWLFPDTMSIEECMVLAKDAGFEGIELCLGENLPRPDRSGSTLVEEAGIGGYRHVELALDTPKRNVQAIAKLARKIGIEVCSVATALNFQYPLTSSDASIRRKGVAVVRKALETASILGAQTIIVIPGLVTEEVSYPQACERAEIEIRKLVSIAENLDVCMGLENVWNKFLLSPIEFRDFIDKMDSRYVGAYFDIANILAYGYPDQWIRILGNRIKSIHVKDFKLSIGNIDGFVNLFRGDVNWPKVMKALYEIQYDGYLTVESIPAYKHHPESQIYEASIALDKLLDR